MSQTEEQQQLASTDSAALVDNSEKQYLNCDEAIEHIGFGFFQVFVTIFCGLTWMSDAMEIMLLSFLMPVLKEKWQLESWQEPTLSAIVFAGIFFGSYTWGFVSDRFGRKISTFALLIFLSVFGIASAFSPNFIVLIIMRGIVGFGLGGAVVPFSLFTEFLPVSKRAIMLLGIEFFWTAGVLASVLLAFLTLPEDGGWRSTLFQGNGWRWYLGLSGAPFVLLIPMLFFMPESPRYLMVSNRMDRVQEVFNQAAKWNCKPQNFTVVSNIAVHSEKRGHIWEIFSRKYLLLTVLNAALWFLQSLCYYGVVMMTPQFFKTSNSDNVYLATLITSLAEIPGLIFSVIIVNRLGRKGTLGILFFLCGASLLGLLLPAPYAVLLIMAIIARGSIMGGSSTVWVFTPEAFPTTVRSIALGASSSFSKVAGMITPYIATMLGAISPVFPVCIYAGSCMLAVFASLALPIETSGKVLKDTFDDEASKPQAKPEEKEQAEVEVEVEAVVEDAQ